MEFVNTSEGEQKSQHEAIDHLHHEGIELLTTSDHHIRLTNNELELGHEDQDDNHVAVSKTPYAAVVQQDSIPEEDLMQSATFEESDFVGKGNKHIMYM